MGRTKLNFERGLLAGVAVFLCFGVLFDYSKNFVHPESVLYLANSFQDSLDLRQIFNFTEFDVAQWPRPRFLSNLFLLLSARFRLLAHGWMAPHPSLNLTWFFSLLVSPWLLYRFLARVFDDRQRALWGVALYLCSVGYLSNLTLFFHPGKPMTAVSLLVALNLASDRRFWGLVACAYLSLFFDESALFILVAVPILFPHMFCRKKELCIWVGVFVAYLTTVTYLAPALIAYLGYGKFEFWKLALRSNEALKTNPVRFFPENVGNLFGSLLFLSHLDSWAKPWLGAIFLFGGVLVTVFRPKGRPFLLLVVAYLLFQTLLMTRVSGRLLHPFYYGNLFSLVVIPFLLCLLPTRGSWARGVVFVLCVGWGLDFVSLNSQWQKKHARLYSDLCPYKQLYGNTVLDAAKSAEFWASPNRDLRPEDCWLLIEKWAALGHRTSMRTIRYSDPLPGAP